MQVSKISQQQLQRMFKIHCPIRRPQVLVN